MDGGVGEALLATEVGGDVAPVMGSSILGTGAGAAGTGIGSGGFGALNLYGTNAIGSLMSPEVAAAIGAGGGEFTPAMLSEGVMPGGGLTTQTVIDPVSNLPVGTNTITAAPEVAQAGGSAQGIYNTTSQGGGGFGLDSLPSWVRGMVTDKKTGEFDPLKAAGYGLGGYTLFNLLTGRGNNYLNPYQPVTAAQMGLGRTLGAGYAPQRRFADGGIAALNVGPGSVATSGVAPSDLQQKANQGITMQDVANIASQYGYSLPTKMADGGIAGLAQNAGYPMAQQPNPRYAVASQMPVSAEQTRMANLPPVPMAAGGELGGYSDGGRMLKGPGDGMSDSIPASISGKQPARLADGEFVVPADVVSHLGNGSTDAGAKQLYKMMDKVRTARTGRKAQGRQINPKKYVPV